MDSTVLIGADDVRHGGLAAREGGQQMQRAAETLCYALERHERFLDDWLSRFADVVDRLAQAMPTTTGET